MMKDEHVIGLHFLGMILSVLLLIGWAFRGSEKREREWERTEREAQACIREGGVYAQRYGFTSYECLR